MPLTKMGHALDAASRGLPVFPQDGKRPRIRNWPANATLKESVIRRWWDRWPDADIGITLPPDIYVLDADTPYSVALAGRILGAEPTLAVATARGVHLYYRVPHELRRLSPLPHAKGGFAELEGKGSPGPVTWAGSVHKSGHVYTIQHDAPIAHMPGVTVRAIGPKPSRAGASGEATDAERKAWHVRCMRVVRAIHAGERPGQLAAIELRADGKANLALARRALRSELGDMPTGWADRFYRAAASVGPDVATGALGLDEAITELTELFYELDEQGGSPYHVLRSIERGVADGARAVQL